MKIKIFLISILLVSVSSIHGMGLTPQEKLFRGANTGNIALIEEALKEGADINSRDNEYININSDVNDNNNTALIKAVLNKKNKSVKKLIEAGADVNLKGFIGSTALMWSAYLGHEVITKQLIKAGADLNLQDELGYTALMKAVEEGDEGIVIQLLDAGADIFIKNDIGKTAIDIARKKGHIGIAKLLEEHLEKKKKEIEQYLPYLPLPSVLQQITAEYLGYPEKTKIPYAEDEEIYEV